MRTGAAPVEETPSRRGREPLAAGGLLFEDFYRQELPGLVVLAAALCGRSGAEDVAQEAMLATYRRWKDVGERDNPAAFARRACTNLAISAYRRRLTEGRALLRLAGRREPAPVDGPAQDAFWEAVRALPRRQAQVTALRYVYDLDIAEIAHTLGVTDGTVKTQLHRARMALRERLGKRAEDES